MKIIGTLVAIANNPKADWVTHLGREAGTVGLHVRIADPSSLATLAKRHGGVIDPTRIVFHLREVAAVTSRTLIANVNRIGGKTIFLADADWNDALAPEFLPPLLAAFPYATRCRGGEELRVELDRLTAPRRGW